MKNAEYRTCKELKEILSIAEEIEQLTRDIDDRYDRSNNDSK